MRTKFLTATDSLFLQPNWSTSRYLRSSPCQRVTARMRGRLSTSFSTDRVGGGRLANFAAEGENESTFWQSKFVDGHLTFRSLRLSQAKCRFMGKVVREISRFFVTPPRVFSLSLWHFLMQKSTPHCKYSVSHSWWNFPHTPYLSYTGSHKTTVSRF